jgi:hypothetical protein
MRSTPAQRDNVFDFDCLVHPGMVFSLYASDLLSVERFKSLRRSGERWIEDL